MEHFFKKITNPRLVLLHLCRYWPFRLVSDEFYLKLLHRTFQKEKLDLNNPISFNQKIEWLKLYDRRNEYTMMTDKYLVRKYVEEKIGSQYLIPLLGVWDNPKNIDFDNLPNEFVLKCNHDMGSVVLCTNKNELNRKKTIRYLNKFYRKNYFWPSREYNYFNIDRKVVAEKYMRDESGELTDYKFFCFQGIPQFIQVDINRFTNHTRNFYTTNWEIIPVENGCKNNLNLKINKPEDLTLMLDLVSKLSKGYPHIRVDLYYINKKIYFGELTFHHGGGAMRVIPREYDDIWGSYLKLPSVQKN